MYIAINKNDTSNNIGIDLSANVLNTMFFYLSFNDISNNKPDTPLFLCPLLKDVTVSNNITIDLSAYVLK
jgi:hypothetical protein